MDIRRTSNRRLRLAVLVCVVSVLFSMLFSMSRSPENNDVVRPVIEVSTFPAEIGLDIASSGAIYISPKQQAAALKHLAKLREPLFCAGTKNYAAISFDDGPSATTPELLKLLKEEGIPATWFDVGKNSASDIPGLKLHARYGPIGNHTWDHSDLTTLSRADIKTELDQRLTDKLGYAEMLWSADSQDGLAKPWRTIAKNAINGLGPGANILFRDGPAARLQD